MDNKSEESSKSSINIEMDKDDSSSREKDRLSRVVDIVGSILLSSLLGLLVILAAWLASPRKFGPVIVVALVVVIVLINMFLVPRKR